PALRCQFTWSGTPNTSHYSGADNNIHILSDDRWDWDVTNHEYTHYLSHLDTLDASPGGNHRLGVSNIGQQHPSNPLRSKIDGCRLAWGEGLATFIGIASQRTNPGAAGQNMPAGLAHVGDTFYTDTIDSTNNYDLETHAGSLEAGEGEEVAV